MTAHKQEVFDPGAYPRTYRLSMTGKWLVSILGLMIVSLDLAAAIYSSRADGVRAPAEAAVLFIVCGGFALAGIYLLAVAAFYHVVLHADSIQVFEVYRRRSLRRGEIEGRSHFANSQGPSGWVLVPKPGYGGIVQLSRLLRIDKIFSVGSVRC